MVDAVGCDRSARFPVANEVVRGVTKRDETPPNRAIRSSDLALAPTTSDKRVVVVNHELHVRERKAARC